MQYFFKRREKHPISSEESFNGHDGRRHSVFPSNLWHEKKKIHQDRENQGSFLRSLQKKIGKTGETRRRMKVM